MNKIRYQGMLFGLLLVTSSGSNMANEGVISINELVEPTSKSNYLNLVLNSNSCKERCDEEWARQKRACDDFWKKGSEPHLSCRDNANKERVVCKEYCSD